MFPVSIGHISNSICKWWIVHCWSTRVYICLNCAQSWFSCKSVCNDPLLFHVLSFAPYINIRFVWWHGLQDPGTYPIPVRETTSEDPTCIVSSSKTLIYLKNPLFLERGYRYTLETSQILHVSREKPWRFVTYCGSTMPKWRRHFRFTEMKKSQGDFFMVKPILGESLTMNWLAKRHSSISIDREMIL